MSNSKLLCVTLAVAVLALGDAHAAKAPPAGSRSATTRASKVVHSPYARAAGAHAMAPTPGNPIKGHSVNMVQGQGISSQRRHALGRPHP
jgi:hypothetical protein